MEDWKIDSECMMHDFNGFSRDADNRANITHFNHKSAESSSLTSRSTSRSLQIVHSRIYVTNSYIALAFMSSVHIIHHLNHLSLSFTTCHPCPDRHDLFRTCPCHPSDPSLLPSWSSRWFLVPSPVRACRTSGYESKSQAARCGGSISPAGTPAP